MHSAATVAEPRGCTNFRLRRATRRVTRHFDAYLGEAGLRTTQYSLLTHLDRAEHLRLADVAREMAMDPSTLTRNLKPLLERGLVHVGPGPDGRSRVARVTAAGRAARAEAARAWKRAQLALNERLGNERVARLHVLLDECLEALDALDTGDDA
jgi:DNA-binding MarR family transcriptional regulator